MAVYYKVDGSIDEEKTVYQEQETPPPPPQPTKADLLAKIEELLAQVAALPSD